MMAQEIKKPAKQIRKLPHGKHVAESALEPRTFDSCPSPLSSVPPGRPVVSKWRFWSWPCGFQVCVTRPHIGMATTEELQVAGSRWLSLPAHEALVVADPPPPLAGGWPSIVSGVAKGIESSLQ